MKSVLQSIVENNELNGITDVAIAKRIIQDAMEPIKRKREVRIFLYHLSECDTIESIQRITYNAYLKYKGMQVLK